MLLYTYTAIAAPLTEALTTVIQRQMAAWGPTLDATIAELLVRALAANGADATRHLSQDHRAEVYVWRVHEGEDTPYVAVVEGPDLCVYAFVPDAQPTTLEALIDRECPRNDRQ